MSRVKLFSTFLLLMLLLFALVISLLAGCAGGERLAAEETIRSYYGHITGGRHEAACKLLTDSCRGSSVEACAQGMARAWKRAEVREVRTLAEWLSSQGGSIESLASYDPRYREKPGTRWYAVTVSVEWQEDWIPNSSAGDNLFFLTLTMEDGEWRIAAIATAP